MSFNESLELLEKLKDSLQKSIAIADEENKTKLMELTQKIDEMNNIAAQKDTEFRNSEEEKNRLKQEIESIKQEVESARQEVKNKDDELNAVSVKLEELRNEKQKVAAEDAKMREEYLAVQEQLKKLSGMYQELSAKQDDAVNIREILSVYIVLLEEVFQGKPHVRILFMLHGDKPQLSREEIVKAGGFQPAIVLHSIHDLAGANLVKYDMDNDTVELVRKIF
jgi:chromosome segregation ATPase